MLSFLHRVVHIRLDIRIYTAVICLHFPIIFITASAKPLSQFLRIQGEMESLVQSLETGEAALSKLGMCTYVWSAILVKFVGIHRKTGIYAERIVFPPFQS